MWRSTRCCWSAKPSAVSGATAATTCVCTWATARARLSRWCGRAWSGSEQLARTGAPVQVSGRYTIHPRFGPQINLRGLAAAVPGSFSPEDLLDGPTRGVKQMEAGGARAAGHDPGAAPADPAWSVFGEDSELWAGYRVRAGRQVLPPGIPPRPARALPGCRPGGERDQRHLPGHRPRRGGHGCAAARHRQARGLHRRHASRKHRPDRRGAAARRDPARLLPHPPHDRGHRGLSPQGWRRRSGTSSSPIMGRSSTAAPWCRARARRRSCT